MTLFTYVRIFAEYSPSVAGDALGHYIWCVNVHEVGAWSWSSKYTGRSNAAWVCVMKWFTAFCPTVEGYGRFLSSWRAMESSIPFHRPNACEPFLYANPGCVGSPGVFITPGISGDRGGVFGKNSYVGEKCQFQPAGPSFCGRFLWLFMLFMGKCLITVKYYMYLKIHHHEYSTTIIHSGLTY